MCNFSRLRRMFCGNLNSKSWVPVRSEKVGGSVGKGWFLFRFPGFACVFFTCSRDWDSSAEFWWRSMIFSGLSEFFLWFLGFFQCFLRFFVDSFAKDFFLFGGVIVSSQFHIVLKGLV